MSYNNNGTRGSIRVSKHANIFFSALIVVSLPTVCWIMLIDRKCPSTINVVEQVQRVTTTKSAEYTLNDLNNSKIDNFNKKSLNKDILSKVLGLKADPPAYSTSYTSTIPVIYLHRPNEGNGIPDYLWKTMTISADKGNFVILITYSSVIVPAGSHIHTFPIESLETDSLITFRKIYRPWGLREPWERENFERFFLLQRYIEISGFQWIFYVDSDVILLSKVSSDIISLECDSIVDLELNHERMKWNTLYWAVWAGTALLQDKVLEDFTQFINKLYLPEFVDLLNEKKEKAPFICDMTAWYLYVGRSDSSLAAQWDWNKNLSLPSTRHWKFCDSQSLGFDHQHGHLSENAGLKSIHFQGGAKQDVFNFQTN